ncbi:MAG: hypothetical protein ACP5PQ_06115 [Thermoproteota archaeon]
MKFLARARIDLISINPDAAVFTRKLVASIEQRIMLRKALDKVKVDPVWDLSTLLVKHEAAVKWVLKNPRALSWLIRASVFEALEAVKGDALDFWSWAKNGAKKVMEKAEALFWEEDWHKGVDEAFKLLEPCGKLAEEITRLAKKVEQDDVIDLLRAFKKIGSSIEEQTKVFEELNAITLKSEEAGSNIVKWLKLVAEEANLKQIIELDLVRKISELDENGLKNIGVAFENFKLVKELAQEPELLSKALPKLKGANYYEFKDRMVDKGGHVYLGGKIEAGDYRIMAEIETSPNSSLIRNY